MVNLARNTGLPYHCDNSCDATLHQMVACYPDGPTYRVRLLRVRPIPSNIDVSDTTELILIGD